MKKNLLEIVFVGPISPILPYKFRIFPCILIDGGTHLKNPPKNSLSIGDGDSAKKKMDIKLSPHKNFTDYRFALSLIPKKAVHLHLFGLFGGRLDHQLAIFGDTVDFLMKRKMRITLYHKKKIKIEFFPKGDTSFNYKGNFSLFSLQKGFFKLTGKAQYKLEKLTKISPMSGHGVSNKANGKVNLSSSVPFFIIYENEA